ncbi:aminotransferase class V-fold PLP-dependent enzyme [Sphingomonas changnyeongensis]|uniref:aminotransferase class V-fold PLP-dependent enzyme n=1 Tax=Sphingomonas changnyeongensis TaxID=2698679 RepID=UPI00191BD1E0|nr:aminotransferase class V-fold PLP-dependent enzyme [Sphingomonas changnyeongensis]
MTLRRYHAPVWDEPVIMATGAPGRRGQLFPLAPEGAALVPPALRRAAPPALPENAEPDVLRHYLRLSQQTMGMIGVSLFGTCTMKYNPRRGEQHAARPEIADLHPAQHPETMQGLLEAVHGLEQILCGLSGMDAFTFQAAGGADAAYTQACITRAYHAARGEAGQRTEIITSIQSHPCNPATAATAGFQVITLPLGPNGYPTLESLEAALSPRTAALMINNPDDMGVYNPEIDVWVRKVKAAGGLAFYDHANFNGVMSKIRARDLGFDACMFMLHKTFGVSKGAVGRRSVPMAARQSWRASCPGRAWLPTANGSILSMAMPQPPGCASSWAICSRCSKPMSGRGRWGPRAFRKRPTCRSS